MSMSMIMIIFFHQIFPEINHVLQWMNNVNKIYIQTRSHFFLLFYNFFFTFVLINSFWFGQSLWFLNYFIFFFNNVKVRMMLFFLYLIFSDLLSFWNFYPMLIFHFNCQLNIFNINHSRFKFIKILNEISNFRNSQSPQIEESFL